MLCAVRRLSPVTITIFEAACAQCTQSRRGRRFNRVGYRQKSEQNSAARHEHHGRTVIAQTVGLGRDRAQVDSGGLHELDAPKSHRLAAHRSANPLARDRGEVADRRRPHRVPGGYGSNGVRQRMLAHLLEALRHAQKGLAIAIGRRVDFRHPRSPLGQRAGLVDDQRVHLFQALDRRRIFDQDPCLRRAADCDHDGHRRRPRPSAHGQAMISTVTEATSACGNTRAGPHQSHAAKVAAATRMTAGTNQPATRSASSWMGAWLRWRRRPAR